MNLEHVVTGIANTALESIGQSARPDAVEMRARVKSVLEDQATVVARALAGQDVSAAQAAIAARIAALQAAGLAITQREVQAAVRSAIMGTLKVVLSAL